MYSITIEGGFSAAHNLREYKGKCEDLHGHNWKIEAVIRSEKLNSIGMVMDFKDFKMHLNALLEELDHKYLNDLEPFIEINPTSENLARYIHDRLKKNIPDLSSITVWENTTSAATYEE